MSTSNSVKLEGPRLRMRLIEPQDGAYVYELRTNPNYNLYLSAITGSVADQEAWITRYKTREASVEEYYFVIERHDGTRCGLVRLYDFESDHFTWGSWILDTNKPAKAALESAVLVYRFAFEHLKCARAVFEVIRDNEHTLHFHRRFGASETGQDDVNTYFEYTAEQFTRDQPQHLQALSS